MTVTSCELDAVLDGVSVADGVDEAVGDCDCDGVVAPVGVGVALEVSDWLGLCVSLVDGEGVDDSDAVEDCDLLIVCDGDGVTVTEAVRDEDGDGVGDGELQLLGVPVMLDVGELLRVRLCD